MTVKFISPPRADRAIPPSLLPKYERDGYIAQIKKNGTYNVTFVDAQGNVTVLKRDGTKHLAWKMDDHCRDFFASFKKHAPTFCTELLHSKVPGIRDVHYIHDIISVQGKTLIGTTYAERYQILLNLFDRGKAEKTGGYWRFNEQMWLARNFEKDFLRLFKSLSKVEDEGLVLKLPKGKWYPNAPSGWTVKVRRPHPNFSF